MMVLAASKFPRTLAAAAVAAGSLCLTAVAAEAATPNPFTMVRSKGLPRVCVPYARASVKIDELGFAEKMTVTLSGLPPGTAFDLFTIQSPDAPFGISWYVGDLETDRYGRAKRSFVGRFNIETFALGLGQVATRKTHPEDQAGKGPAFDPIHTYHLGLWFDSPEDAAKAGCPGFTTPFNGEHNAGVQVLSTRNFPLNAGPLKGFD